ncbi:hypothetical protein PHLGIDRAFT_117001 [Phlebiopsis gigantea 11061_1 CR5-6]|uniref:RING-type domain-containing protein n=1 Tax=Phlebiopsis gigantea (strain 11061_1 CR5-6) TaxID=745531 RepID=A0A0C3NTY0_PHLG1|nr:hypothetical protein PHLGIDRAFT_117001 [Phlebiopsis gigantea 11061_1 CR5-6]
MHFAKTYTQLLLSLPPELRENAIEYRKLKKLINKVVSELQDLGYPPDKLHHVLLESTATADPTAKGKARQKDQPWVEISSSQDASTGVPRVVYEIKADSDRLEPRLRLLVNSPNENSSELPLSAVTSLENVSAAGFTGTDDPTESSPSEGTSALSPSDAVLEGTSALVKGDSLENVLQISTHDPELQEVVIPLVSDTAFFEALMQALQNLSTQMGAVSDEFMENLDSLSRMVAAAARPMSSTSSVFQPHSSGSNPSTVSVHTPTHLPLIHRGTKTDLYSWREIFQLYLDTEVFESHSEKTRGERSVEEAEARLVLFKQRLDERGYEDGTALKLKQSKDALQAFLDLNSFFQFATGEATRKILKKHAKRTALPVSPSLRSRFALPAPRLAHSSGTPSSSSSLVHFAPRASTSLALMLVQAMGETLLPIIPHIDDYACVICTSIAFKPIRLRCGHLFCVRCLVKMQKRGKGNCPMCRAPTVLSADRTNVDWALLNFMKDWFPIEAREKLDQSEKEAAEEHMRELGFDPNASSCVIA